MFALRLKNFRNFADTGQIDIRPITVLLGRNGSGKSSLTRVFPMLRQTFENRSAAPLLLLGNYVDFGGFDDVRSTADPDAPIIFEIGASSSFFSSYRTRLLPPYQRFPRLKVSDTFTKIVYEARIMHRSDRTQLDSFCIQLDDDIASFQLTSTGRISNFVFNHQDFTNFTNSDDFLLIRSQLVPRFVLVDPREPTLEQPNIGGYGPRRQRDNIYSFYKSHLHGRTGETTINRILQQTRYFPGSRFLEELERYNPGLSYWKDVIDHLKTNEVLNEKLRARYFLRDVDYYLQFLDLTFQHVFRNCLYVGPSRATGERYYRLQELSVDFIDPKGTNFAMFLYSLSKEERKSFSSWVERIFRFRVEIKQHTGHASVLVGESGSEKLHNLADVGYGYSQLLPILAQMWLRQPKVAEGRPPFSLVCFEQPELHLHPAMQAHLADAFCDAVYLPDQRRRSGLHFVIETHSEALVNRLGELVSEGVVKAKDIMIFIFNKEIDHPTQIQRANFNKEGALENWPFGFFSWS